MNEQSLSAESLSRTMGPDRLAGRMKTAIDPTFQPSLTKLGRNVGEKPQGNSPFKRRDPRW